MMTRPVRTISPSLINSIELCPVNGYLLDQPENLCINFVVPDSTGSLLCTSVALFVPKSDFSNNKDLNGDASPNYSIK